MIAGTQDNAAVAERAKYEGIYGAGGSYARYGHTNHGKGALGILIKWSADSLLDVGCGWNEFCKAAREALPEITATGVDFACPGADVIADATALPFADKTADVLTAFDMLEHVLPEQVDAVLAEFARVSRRFIFSISHVASVIKWKGENLHPTVRGLNWWLLRIMRAGGCKIEKRGRYITGEWQPVLKLAPETRCVLVGNGPSILNGRGAAIDSFTEVVRFNTFHIGEFAEHTGTRTTLWSTFGRGQVPACDQRPDRVIYIHGESGEPAYAPRDLFRIPRWFYSETRDHVKKRAWWNGGFTQDPESFLASSGLLVASWLLQVVGLHSITLAGFDHFGKAASKQHHYWMPQAFGQPKEHCAAVESAMFAELRDAGRVNYL